MENDILQDDVLKIPIKYDKREGFLNETSKKLDSYVDLLKRRKADDHLVSRIIDFKKKYELCIKNYYKGKRYLAYKNFNESINSLDLDIESLTNTLDSNLFYKARINDSFRPFGMNEMYHIGFNNRTIVKTQRYSFPGLPCLYLGASSYVCWVEMDCPKAEDFQVALLRKKGERIRYIDLGILPNKQYEALTENKARMTLDKYILLWPLIAMCSVVVNDADAPFKPEYIFPQFLLEYVLHERKNKELSIDGIKYASVKMASISQQQYYNCDCTYMCYVFPTKSDIDSSSKLDKDLLNKFTVESTYSGRMLQVLTDACRDFDFGDVSDDDEKRIYTDNTYMMYRDTIFYRIEDVLNDDKIMDYITKKGGATLMDIASNIGWTKELTKERLDKLHKEKRISITVEENNVKLYKPITTENYNV